MAYTIPRILNNPDIEVSGQIFHSKLAKRKPLEAIIIQEQIILPINAPERYVICQFYFYSPQCQYHSNPTRIYD